MSDRLPAPWTSALCPHCGAEHPPSEDCLPAFDEGGNIDLFEALEELFGTPEEIGPGFFIFSRGPKR